MAIEDTQQGAEAHFEIAHSIDETQLLQTLGTSASTGLSAKQAEQIRAKAGSNSWEIKQKTTALDILIRQVSNILIWMLIISAAVAAAVGHWLDAIGIAVAVLLSVVFGFVQEYKAEEALGALQKMTAPKARVVREGTEVEIAADMLVPGDIVVLREGDLIPADVRLLGGAQMRTDQSLLTGESAPINKQGGTLQQNTPMAERANLAYAGTQVVHGSGKVVVFATGLNTQFGRIAKSLADVGNEQTPLQKSLGELGDRIGKVSIGLCIVFFVVGIATGGKWDTMLITAVSMAVAAIPEGLPTVLAITLALGVQRMAKHNALVRKLQAVETLGCASVICTDKTGTLTANRMSVVRANFAGVDYRFRGGPLDMSTAVSRGDGRPMSAKDGEQVARSMLVGVLCNEAVLLRSNDGILENIRGDPTEAALLVGAAKAGVEIDRARAEHAKTAEVPFDYHRKMMTQVRKDGRRTTAYVKGAPERVLALCTKIQTMDGEKKLTSAMRAELHIRVEEYSHQALRTLAYAKKEVKEAGRDKAAMGEKQLEKDLTWVGFVGMIDPPRPEVADALSLCKQAGIRVVMLTGDAPATAKAIAVSLGLLDAGGQVLTGEELGKLSEGQLNLYLPRLQVLARATPEDKYRIVTAMQKAGEVVAVTGDGVNDAPSIKRADIGVAMGIGGTDVARGAADMVLVDNNFSTLVHAVEHGRSIYDNIRSFVRFQFTTNVAALSLMFITPLVGLGLPLLPLQILWINIIMDGPPALALGLEPGRPDAMTKKPRKKDAPFVSRPFLTNIVSSGLLMFVMTLAIFAYYGASREQAVAAKAGTMAFTAFIVLQLVNAFNCRSVKMCAWHNILGNKWLLLAAFASLCLHVAIIYTPMLQSMFSVVPLAAEDWAVVVAAGALILAKEELTKRFWVGGQID